MPRDLTSLGGAEAAASQIPVTLLRLEIPSDERRYCDIDVTVYLNPTTNAVSMSPGAGLVAFAPYAGLSAPEIEISDEMPLGEVSISVSNVDGDWWQVMADNVYRDAPATIWQGNLTLSPGTSPTGITFAGAVKQWKGDLVHIVANRQVATLILAPPDVFRLPLPWRTYSAPAFKHLPAPGKKLIFGFTEKEI